MGDVIYSLETAAMRLEQLNDVPAFHSEDTAQAIEHIESAVRCLENHMKELREQFGED